jgi:hypothetical protein
VKATFHIPVMEKKLLIPGWTSRWSVGNQRLVNAYLCSMDDVQNYILKICHCLMYIVAFLLIIRKLGSYNFLHDISVLMTWQQVSVAENFAGY